MHRVKVSERLSQRKLLGECNGKLIKPEENNGGAALSFVRLDSPNL